MDNLLLWFEKVFMSANLKKSVHIAMILWAVWTTRNDLIWKNKQRSQDAILNLGLRFLDSWRNAQRPQEAQTAACLNSGPGFLT